VLLQPAGDQAENRAGQVAAPVRSLTEFRRRVQPIRHDGYAIQDQELAAGFRFVTVPVYAGGSSPVAALNLAVAGVPSRRHLADP
jgi:IclR family transcriptional regulator, pca regulon regulatory protein